jgi:hypothetical protein
MASTDWVRVGRTLRARRAELGLPSSKDLGPRGGPSHYTVRRMEAGDAEVFSARNVSNLEKALDWPPGHIEDLIAATTEEPAASGPPTRPMLRLAAMAREYAAPDWEQQVKDEIGAQEVPDFPDGEVGEMLRREWDRLTDAGLDPVNVGLGRIVAWWRMMTADTDAGRPAFPSHLTMG